MQPKAIALGTLRSATCSGQASDLLHLEFLYGRSANNGNVVEQKITVPGLPSVLTQTYAYDEVNRLEPVSEGGWTRDYLYDAFGNRAVTGSEPGANVGLGTPQSLTDFDSTTNHHRR